VTRFIKPPNPARRVGFRSPFPPVPSVTSRSQIQKSKIGGEHAFKRGPRPFFPPRNRPVAAQNDLSLVLADRPFRIERPNLNSSGKSSNEYQPATPKCPNECGSGNPRDTLHCVGPPPARQGPTATFRERFRPNRSPSIQFHGVAEPAVSQTWQGPGSPAEGELSTEKCLESVGPTKKLVPLPGCHKSVEGNDFLPLVG